MPKPSKSARCFMAARALGRLRALTTEAAIEAKGRGWTPSTYAETNSADNFVRDLKEFAPGHRGDIEKLERTIRRMLGSYEKEDRKALLANAERAGLQLGLLAVKLAKACEVDLTKNNRTEILTRIGSARPR